MANRELEDDHDRIGGVSFIDLDKLRHAIGTDTSSETSSRFRKWGAIALVTWAAASTAIAVMEWRTIEELEKITAQIERAVEHEVSK